MNKYKFTNLKEIVDTITDKNIDVFLKDFDIWMRMGLELKKTKGVIVKKEPYSFGWIDDGIVGISKIKIEIR